MIRMTIQQRRQAITALRRALRLRGNQAAIARAAHITAQAVGRWEVVPQRHVELVANITGVPARLLRPDLYQGSRSKMATEEVWRVSPSFPDYEVSSRGHVRRLTAAKGTRAGRMKSPSFSHQYAYVSVGKTRKSVHWLICEAFHGASPSLKHEVAHNDGKPKNLDPSNLRWATKSENNKDMDKHGTRNPPRGEMQGRHKLTKRQVRKVFVMHANGVGVCAIARTFGVFHGTIGHILRGRNWAHLNLTKNRSDYGKKSR